MRIQFLILLIFTLFVDIAKGADTFVIKLNNNDVPVQFCTAPELIAKDLTIDGTFAITGMKISFSQNYNQSEDELTYTGSIGNIVPTWFAGQGYLLLKGDGNTTKENYRDAIKLVTYKNNNSIPTLGTRKISITLEDADYLPATGHFYRFVEKSNMSWSAARAEAESVTYYGLKGYLATITSQVENDFIKLKTKGVGWIGASDAGAEGQWRWVTGPEGTEDGGKGRLFYVAGSGPYLGQYTNWNSGEPNNVNGGENYAHITVFPNDPGSSYKWNDLPDSGGTGDYASRGYLIEFGGFPDEGTLALSATLNLQVNTMLFNTGTVPPICEGKSYMLNMADLNVIPATYSWTPVESLSSASVANPYATPVVTTTYTVIGNRGACNNTATYTLPVNPKPVSLLNPIENICKDQPKTLDPGSNPGYTYLWNNGSVAQTITVNAAGIYNVAITTDKGCSLPFKTEVIVHEYPTIDLSNLKLLICGDAKSTAVNISRSPVEATYSLTSVDGRANVNGLNVSAPDFGVYPLVYKAAIYPSCPVEKKFDLSFYKTPKVDFTINEQKCYGYNLAAEYLGDADVTSARFTWIFGGDTIIDGIGRYKETIPLGVNQANRNLVLKVEQNGCSDEHTLSDIRVIPTMSMSVNKPILCQPELFEFKATNTETGVTYDWDFGDGSKGTGSNPQHTYAQSGKYNIQATVTTNQNCTNTALIKEMVFAAPIPDVKFSLSPEGCLNPGENQIKYIGDIGTANDKYQWDLSSFDPSEIIKDPLQTQGPLVFDLKTKPQATVGLTVKSEFGCESLPGSIVLKRKPDFTISPTLIAGCVPLETQLSGVIKDSDKINFTWDFGDGLTGSGSPVLHTYEQPDKSYTITLTGKSSVTSCPNVVVGTDFLKTYPKPTAKFSMDNKVVYNDKPDVKFTDLSIGNPTTWLWNFGDGATSVLQNPSYHFTKMGHQKVLLEVSNSDFCTDTISRNLLVAFDRLFPPNGFSPNAPNSIDREFLLNSEGIVTEGYHFTVLSRWNDVVFEAKDEIKGWDGRMANGTFAPPGAYVWILNFTDFIGRKHQQTGTVTLVF